MMAILNGILLLGFALLVWVFIIIQFMPVRQPLPSSSVWETLGVLWGTLWRGLAGLVALFVLVRLILLMI